MQYLINYNGQINRADYTHDAALILELAGADRIKAIRALRAARETGCLVQCTIGRGDGVALIAARVPLGC